VRALVVEGMIAGRQRIATGRWGRRHPAAGRRASGALGVAPAVSPRRAAGRAATGRRLWARWTLATTLGEAVGFAVPAAVGVLAYALAFPDGTLVLLAVAAGAGEGAILGFAQSRVLRRELFGLPPRRWVAATAAAAALGWAVGMPLGVYGASLPLPLLVPALVLAGVVLLGAVGGAQWLVLRRHVARAGPWVPANALAWLLGLAVAFAGMSLLREGDPAAVVLAVGVGSGLGMGFVVAAVTGFALVRLLRPRTGGRARLPRAVLLSRLVHGLISLLFLACIALIYAAAWQGRAGVLTLVAIGALTLEGMLVALSRGNCPLGPVFRRLGDEKPFFELLLPPRAAKAAVPVLGAVTVVGLVLLVARALA
jgi:hypothetical protein